MLPEQIEATRTRVARSYRCDAMPLIVTVSIAAIDTVTPTSAGTAFEAGNFRGKIPTWQVKQEDGVSLRPPEFSSHICEADRPPDLDRAHNYHFAPCNPAGSRSKCAIRRRPDLYRAHSYRPALCNPADSRSKFASHHHNRRAAAAGNNTEHPPGLCRQRARCQ